jgi:hypothetical protein
VDANGELRIAGRAGPAGAGLRAGSAIATVFEGLLAVSSPAAPAAEDAVSFVAVAEGEATVAETIPVDGTIRALSSHPTAEGVRLLAAVEEAGATSRLLLLDLRRREP